MPLIPAMPWRLPLAFGGGQNAAPPAGKSLLALPFDALRAHYANAVQAGLVERSLLASARVERQLDALERLLLGPLARRV
ncbi:MAG: hypothetical protein HY855_14870 [Burkholderiales bacterium]|nr:hypothetical protein [Burkholderiales bacterium]